MSGTKVRKIFYPQEQAPDEGSVYRVAAYCRVSTMSDNQESSYETQKAVYTEKIRATKGWTLAGIYADSGISGTSVRQRTEFLRMIEEKSF